MRSRGSVTQSNPSVSNSGSTTSGNTQKKTATYKVVTIDITISKNNPPVNKTTNTELDFNIVDELKRTRASISLFKLAKIAQFQNEIVNSLPGKGPNLPQQPITSINTQDSSVDGSTIGQRSRLVTPPFLLTFKIFNNNVHNYMVDSRASSNVIPFSVCQKLNIDPKKEIYRMCNWIALKSRF